MSLRLVAGLLAFPLAAASLVAQSSVWKVTRGSSVLYLGGTCHVLRASDRPLPREFDEAYAASAALYFETDVAQLQSPAAQQAVLMQGMFTDGRTLADVLTPAAWKSTQAYCEKAGLPLAQFSAMRPWLFTMMMAIVELQKLGVSMEGVDLHFHKKATAAGKKTGELETFETHLNFLTHLGEGHESQMILQSIDDLKDMPKMINDLLASWKSGDVTKLDQLMLHDMRTKYPAVYQELIVKRNQAWLPKIEALAKTPEVEFILVGAGHMAGKDGLLAQLRAKGYTITQTKAAPAAKK